MSVSRKPFRMRWLTRDDIPPELIEAGMECDPVGLVAEGPSGEIMAMGFVSWHFGRAFVFLDIRDEGMRRPMFLHRRAMIFLKMLAEAGEESVWTVCDHSKPRAETWLRRLGFVETNEETPQGNLWKCQIL